MDRTCGPDCIANQIIQAASRLGVGGTDSQTWQEVARLEFERHTLGLHDFERDEVLVAIIARTRGRIRG